MSFIPEKDDKGNIVLRNANVKVDEFLRVRHKGIMDATIASMGTLDIDYEIEQLSYFGANKPSAMVGIQFKIVGGNDGDKIDFCIIDKNNVVGYGANFVLDQFGDGFYVFENEIGEIREHQASLIPGVFIRAHYVNTGANQARFICNLLRYMDTK